MHNAFDNIKNHDDICKELKAYKYAWVKITFSGELHIWEFQMKSTFKETKRRLLSQLGQIKFKNEQLYIHTDTVL